MGTPFAVTIANAFMYYHEKDIIEQYSNYLLLYRRFIDDIFAIWVGPKDTPSRLSRSSSIPKAVL